MIRIVLIPFLLASVWACTTPEPGPRPGPWRCVIDVQGEDLPFTLFIEGDSSGRFEASIKNAEERLPIDSIVVVGDSVIFPLYIFDAELRARIFHDDSLSGFYIKKYEKDYRLPFTASFGKSYRFADTQGITPGVDFSGKYAVTFYGEQDTTWAVGIFRQNGSNAEGTFLTTTGDYRYLEGNVINDRLHLSTFDAVHTFLFTADQINDSTLSGEFWSGKSVHERWRAIKDPGASLADVNAITGIKDGSQPFSFAFPDPEGRPVTSEDERFRGKVLIIQLMGTWCPNCMDETRFLAPWYRANKHRGVEIVGLDFEPYADFDYTSNRVKRMISKLDIPYEVLLAGSRRSDSVASALPMLEHFIAFPTTIFVGRDGRVKKVHTGFSGPGTGAYYDAFKEEFNATINQLLGDN